MEPLTQLLAVVCCVGMLTSRQHKQNQKASDEKPSGLIAFSKVCFVTAIVYLSWLNLDLNGSALSKNTSFARPERMMLVAVVWMMSLRSISLILWPLTAPNQNVSLPWYQFLVREWLWYFALPVVKTQEAIPKLRHQNIRSTILPFVTSYGVFLLGNTGLILGKMVISEVTYAYLRRCSIEVDIRSSPFSSQILYTTLFSVYTISSPYVFDIQRIVMRLVSGGHFDFLPFNRWPLLSTSVTEFWGKRYNQLVHSLLKDSFYKPFRFQLGWTKATSTMVIFLLSGLLHVHVVYACFQERLREALSFFVLQALAMMYLDPILLSIQAQEKSTMNTSNTKWKKKLDETSSFLVGNFFTMVFLATTLTLYLGTMTYHLPGFADDPTPFMSPYVAWVDTVQCI